MHQYTTVHCMDHLHGFTCMSNKKLFYNIITINIIPYHHDEYIIYFAIKIELILMKTIRIRNVLGKKTISRSGKQ